jgi:hypothetical protein
MRRVGVGNIPRQHLLSIGAQGKRLLLQEECDCQAC